MNLVLVLGNQLFDPRILSGKGLCKKNTIVFMREDHELATYFRFHKHKIIFFLAAMRSYRDELRAHGYRVHYEELDINSERLLSVSFETALEEFARGKRVDSISLFEVEDKPFEKRILALFRKNKWHANIWESPMFLTSRPQFQSYLMSTRRPLMKSFYELQRRRHGILMENDGPLGGVWSFDPQNRRPLNREYPTPHLPDVEFGEHVPRVQELVNALFSSHPGRSVDFWLPVDRRQAQSWLQVFLSERLYNFGPYEDALAPHSDFVFHSVLTPFLNTGLLTPREVIELTLKFARTNEIPLASLEGFIRQILGWREFIRGIYQNFGELQETGNFWNHHNRLSPLWWSGNTGIPPLDKTLSKVLRRGYAHHIERLMVLGSLMLLLEIHPSEAYRWFMEMFVDSSDWVMGPNIFGMALFSDGGIFSTKPYICGSNYLRKMGGYSKASWCDGVDGLYWSFIKKHEAFFLRNPRLSMIARSHQRIPPARWKQLALEANRLREKLVLVN